MSNGLILFLVFTTSIVILILYFFLIKNRKKRHLVSLEYDWDNFEKAIAQKDIIGINKYGTELIWNENLTDSILKEMNSYVENLDVENSELENLKNLILNKKTALDKR
jgi:hypothetical protein